MAAPHEPWTVTWTKAFLSHPPQEDHFWASEVTFMFPEISKYIPIYLSIYLSIYILYHRNVVCVYIYNRNVYLPKVLRDLTISKQQILGSGKKKTREWRSYPAKCLVRRKCPRDLIPLLFTSIHSWDLWMFIAPKMVFFRFYCNPCPH